MCEKGTRGAGSQRHSRDKLVLLRVEDAELVLQCHDQARTIHAEVQHRTCKAQARKLFVRAFQVIMKNLLAQGEREEESSCRKTAKHTLTTRGSELEASPVPTT